MHISFFKKVLFCYSAQNMLGFVLGHPFLYAIVYCYLEFKLCYLKNLKLFSIRVKNYLSRKSWETKATGFNSFKSIILRNRSLSNARGFYGERCKIWNGNLYLIENRLSRNYNYTCICHMYKRIWRSELWLNSYWQVIKSSRNCPIFHIFAKVIFF